MGKNKKIGIIGHFGGSENILDGQTIKTKILFNELIEKTEWDIITVDTYYKKKNPLKLLKDTIKCLMTTRDIVIMLSVNGMRIYFPLLSFFSRFFHKRIYHDVIGGNLDRIVERYPKFKRYLNSFKVNWVETDDLKKRLEKCGINNCKVIPNFKRLNVVEISDSEYEEPFRFCLFSRVMKEKGVEIAIDAIQSINSDYKRNVCELDIFGRIDEGYKKDFEKIMEGVTNAVRYRGMVPFDKSVEAIKDYYALLFPTYWVGEGFPGTIIDAFSAGLPVIGTDWNCNGEIIENKINGVLYPNEEISDLKEAVKWMINHKSNITILKNNCIETAKKYQPDRYVEQMLECIDRG